MIRKLHSGSLENESNRSCAPEREPLIVCSHMTLDSSVSRMINSRTCLRGTASSSRGNPGCILIPGDFPRTRDDREFEIFGDQLTQLGIDQMLRPLNPELSSILNRACRLLTETRLRDKVPGDGEYVFLVRLMIANGFIHFVLAY
jgi:hypothetical protein